MTTDKIIMMSVILVCVIGFGHCVFAYPFTYPIINHKTSEFLKTNEENYYCDPKINCPVYHAPTEWDQFMEEISNPSFIPFMLPLVLCLIVGVYLFVEDIQRLRGKIN